MTLYQKSRANASMFFRTGQEVKENSQKDLQYILFFDIVFWRDCMRYALKQKVAAPIAGNFCGVCPILNRAPFLKCARMTA